MSRFHCTALIAAIAIAGTLAFGQWLAMVGVFVALLVVVGFGVAIPKLRFFGPFICHGNSAQRQVALTFDDGPDPNSTPALLQVLREHQVEAAFFVMGRKVDTYPALANQILRGGHLLENHSYHHSNTTNCYSTSRLTAELAQAQQAIAKHTGTTPRYFRPPIGLSNPNVFHAAGKLRMKVVGWNIRSLDTRITDPARIVQRIERALCPGAIILLHDGNIPAERLVVTVKLLLSKLREHGYTVVRLDRMLG